MKWTIRGIACLAIFVTAARWLKKRGQHTASRDLPAEWLASDALPCSECSGKVSPLRTMDGWLMVCGLCGTASTREDYQRVMELERTGTEG